MANGIYMGVAVARRSNSLKHWKYIKKEEKNGYTRYYYDTSKSDSSSSSKTTDTGETKTTDTNKTTTDTSASDGFDLDEMANQIIKGNFSNGEKRKELLGESYAEIQHRVNQILLGEEKAQEILNRRNQSK